MVQTELRNYLRCATSCEITQILESPDCRTFQRKPAVLEGTIYCAALAATKHDGAFDEGAAKVSLLVDGYALAVDGLVGHFFHAGMLTQH